MAKVLACHSEGRGSIPAASESLSILLGGKAEQWIQAQLNWTDLANKVMQKNLS